MDKYMKSTSRVEYKVFIQNIMNNDSESFPS